MTVPTPMTVVVDVANVLGSRPDGWWRDRVGAAGRLLDRLAPLIGMSVDDDRRIGRVVAVLEGAAVSAPAPDGVDVVRADRDGDSAIVTLVHAAPAAEPLLVVTADRGLRQRLPAGVGTVGPNWLNALIGR